MAEKNRAQGKSKKEERCDPDHSEPVSTSFLRQALYGGYLSHTVVLSFLCRFVHSCAGHLLYAEIVL